MVFCSKCKKKINPDKIDGAYKISLGNIINDKFYENVIYYYHIDCLNLDKETQPRYYLSQTH
jgi:hypothetical protein